MQGLYRDGKMLHPFPMWEIKWELREINVRHLIRFLKLFIYTKLIMKKILEDKKRNLLFSYRKNIKKVKSVVQTESMDMDLRIKNRIVERSVYELYI